MSIINSSNIQANMPDTVPCDQPMISNINAIILIGDTLTEFGFQFMVVAL
jgi:hypothetical protein